MMQFTFHYWSPIWCNLLWADAAAVKPVVLTDVLAELEYSYIKWRRTQDVVREHVCDVSVGGFLCPLHSGDVILKPPIFQVLNLYFVGRDSSAGTATRYGLDDPGIESRSARDFPHLSRQTLGLPCLFPGDKVAGVWRWPLLLLAPTIKK